MSIPNKEVLQQSHLPWQGHQLGIGVQIPETVGEILIQATTMSYF